MMEHWCYETEADKLESYYRGIIPLITKVARRYGYAIGVHGSLRRDLDLIAVPWVANPKPSQKLKQAIQKAIGGLDASQGWTTKPHGRRSIVILVGKVAYVDLSVSVFIE